MSNAAASVKSEHVPPNQPDRCEDDDDLTFDFYFDNPSGSPGEPDDEANIVPTCKWKDHQFWTYVDEQLDEVRELATKHIPDKQGQDTKVTKYVSWLISATMAYDSIVDSLLHACRMIGRNIHLVAVLVLWWVQLSVHPGRQQFRTGYVVNIGHLTIPHLQYMTSCFPTGLNY